MSQLLRLWTMLALTLFVAGSFGLTGCGKKTGTGTGTGAGNKGEAEGNPKVIETNFEKLKDGMSRKEVIDVLGEPSETKEGGKQLVWQSGPNSITVGFKEEKVEYKLKTFVKVTPR